MSGIFGHLNLNDNERVYQATTGQALIFEAAQAYIDRVNADIMQAMSVFVSGTTENHKERFKLPGGGTLQRRDDSGRYGAVKATGSWDVAYPLEDFGAMLAGTDVAMAYMTVAELGNHVSTIVQQNVNTVRFELLKALFNNAQDTFVDPLWGSLSIEPLANGDSVVYPPVLGSTTEATESHYLGSAYAAASISDTNDPYITIADELEEHFGSPTGGSDIAVFINNGQRAKTLDLAAFTPVTDMAITPGNDTATVNSVPPKIMANSGWRVLGRHDEAGVWVVEWRHIPATWMLGVHLGAPAPLKMRVDPANTGLGQGLTLTSTDEKYPFMESIWRNRFGFGVGNRLNGAVIDLSNTDSDYDIPAAYA